MAFPVVASSAKRSSSDSVSTSITITAPSGIASGDVLLAWFVGAGASVSVSLTGWTILNEQVDSVSGNKLHVWAYKVAGGSEPGSYTFTTSGTSGYWCGAMLRITGAGTPVYGGRSTSVTNNTSIPHPSMNTPTTDCLVVLGAYSGWLSSHTMAPPAGFTEHQEDTGSGASERKLNMSTNGQAAAGATGAVNTTLSGNSQLKIGGVAAVPPGAPAGAAFIPQIIVS